MTSLQAPAAEMDPFAHDGGSLSLSENGDALVSMLDALGIKRELLASRGLPFHPVAAKLTVAETRDGTIHRLVPAAADAWNALKLHASQDGVALEIVSAFRSLEEQRRIILDKLALGMDLERILTLSAPPGYSEHHTGRAVDVNTPGCAPREEAFENTEAFRWLCAHAGHFGFLLSYPRGNRSGFIHEPWHWLFRAAGAAD